MTEGKLGGLVEVVSHTKMTLRSYEPTAQAEAFSTSNSLLHRSSVTEGTPCAPQRRHPPESSEQHGRVIALAKRSTGIGNWSVGPQSKSVNHRNRTNTTKTQRTTGSGMPTAVNQTTSQEGPDPIHPLVAEARWLSPNPHCLPCRPRSAVAHSLHWQLVT